MVDKKTVFVAFAIEEERMCDLLKGQSLHPRSPYEFIDMSVKVTYRMGRTKLERTLRRRLIAYNQPMIVTLGPGAGADPTKGVFDATLALQPGPMLEVMEAP